MGRWALYAAGLVAGAFLGAFVAGKLIWRDPGPAFTASTADEIRAATERWWAGRATTADYPALVAARLAAPRPPRDREVRAHPLDAPGPPGR